MSVGVPASADTVGAQVLACPPELTLFDAVGTLIEPDPPVAQAYYNVASQMRDLGLTTSMISYRFKDAWKLSHQSGEAIQRAGRTSEAIEIERWAAIVREVFAETDDVRAEMLFTQLWQHFAEPWHWRVFEDVVPTLTELRQRGYRIGIASNFDQRLTRICREHECLANIDPLFISSQLGWSKPALQFYQAIEKITGIQPRRILFVGDDYENDVTAPRSLGWQACWLRRDRKSSRRPAIFSLTDLLKFL